MQLGLLLCLLHERKHVCFNVKSYKECHKDKKGIQKAVTGLVSVPDLISCEMTQTRDEGNYRRRLVDH